MFKKTAIAALVLGFSGAASAAMYAPAPAPACAAGNVTVPCERSAWDLGVDALYMRADDSLGSLGNLGSVTNLDYDRPSTGWGWALEGSYHFGTGNDFTVNWAHFDKKTTFSNGVDLTNKFDFVNAELAQHVDMGENVDVRLQMGVQYAMIEDVVSGTSIKYSGFGPRTGAKMTYDFGNGFGLYGDGNIALINGKVDNTNIHSNALSTDAAIGVAYTHAMAQGDLTARVGWNVRKLSGITAIGLTQSYSGLNLGLKWVGNA